MIGAIPKSKLPHTALYYEYIEDTGEGGNFNIPITLTNIKIEEIKQYASTSNGREIIGNALMFYDYVNSSGICKEFINNSKILFNNRIYYIVSNEILYANTPHHCEVMLK